MESENLLSDNDENIIDMRGTWTYYYFGKIKGLGPEVTGGNTKEVTSAQFAARQTVQQTTRAQIYSIGSTLSTRSDCQYTQEMINNKVNLVYLR